MDSGDQWDHALGSGFCDLCRPSGHHWASSWVGTTTMLSILSCSSPQLPLPSSLLLHTRCRLSSESQGASLSAGAQTLPLEGLWRRLSSPPSAQAALPVIHVRLWLQPVWTQMWPQSLLQAEGRHRQPFRSGEWVVVLNNGDITENPAL